MDGPLLEIHALEHALQDELKHAKASKDRKRQFEIKDQLTNLYIKYGEYFKTSDHPEPTIAIRLLENALKLVRNHSIANYRLGHLYYRKDQFEKAAFHFNNALEWNSPKLNDTQRYITQLFLANCGVMITKQAVKLLEEMEFQIDLNINEEMIERYRGEIVVTEENTINQLYYRKITTEGATIIPREQYYMVQDECCPNTVVLIMHENGFSIKLGDFIESLHLNAFRVLYTIVTAKTFMTNGTIHEKLTGRNSEEIDEDTIRQIISRLKRQLPVWDEIIEVKNIGRKRGRKLHEDYTYMILCRVEDVLPDE